jgi:hypothetical protein
MFKSDKTVLVHYIRLASRLSTIPIVIKGKIVALKLEAKLLSVIINLELQYKNYIADTAAKGLKAAFALKRLKAILLLLVQ